MVKIDFEFQTEYGLYRDALWLPDDHGLTDEQIKAMQQARVNNWIAIVTAPPVEEILPADEIPQETVNG